MTDKTFTIIPARNLTYLTILGILLITLIPFIVLVVMCIQDIKQFSWIVFVELFFMLVAIVVGAMFVYFGYSARNTKFVINNEELRIEGALYGRVISKDLLVTQDVRIINLIEDSTYKPRIRTNGVGLPGYLEGWFRLKNREKALLFVTNRKQVVYIPAKDGYSVLLSVTEPEEFLREVRQL